MRLLPMSLTISCLAVAGCVTRPDRAEIFVETTPPGADCTLVRDGEPIATVSPSPGIAWVPPGASDVTIACRRNGFHDTSAVAHSLSRNPSLSEAITGSITHYEYESPVVIALTPQ